MKTTARTLTLYIAIGAITASVDIVVYRFMLTVSSIPAAVSVAYISAAVVQFTLNKYLNFRDFRRSTASQARSYLAVSVLSWSFTVACVEVLVHGVHFSAFAAKVASLPLTAAFGYWSTRYIVFGPGLRGLFQRANVREL